MRPMRDSDIWMLLGPLLIILAMGAMVAGVVAILAG